MWITLLWHDVMRIVIASHGNSTAPTLPGTLQETPEVQSLQGSTDMLSLRCLKSDSQIVANEIVSFKDLQYYNPQNYI